MVDNVARQRSMHQIISWQGVACVRALYRSLSLPSRGQGRGAMSEPADLGGEPVDPRQRWRYSKQHNAYNILAREAVRLQASK